MLVLLKSPPQSRNESAERAKRCRTTMWRSRIWSGTRSCRPTRTRARAGTCSRSRRKTLCSAKKSLDALAALSTSPSSTTSKISSPIPIKIDQTRASNLPSSNPSPLLEFQVPYLIFLIHNRNDIGCFYIPDEFNFARSLLDCM